MAEAKTAPIPTPAPKPEPPKNLAKEAEATIDKVKTGFDPLRPLRYANAFIRGTINDGFNNFAQYGRKGGKLGLIAGIVTGIALGSIGPVIAVAAAGFLATGALGGAKGFLTGGMRAVNRERRAVLYAEDLIDRSHTRAASPPNKHDYRAAYHAHQAHNDRVTQQVLVREAERAQDDKMYWQEHVSSRGHSNGRGF